MSGHLDTYPVNEALPWTVDPFAGELREGRLYGRGAADMKGGIAASMSALALLAEHRTMWRGEAVLALAGDEESMGERGTQWLIDNVPQVACDAVIIGCRLAMCRSLRRERILVDRTGGARQAGPRRSRPPRHQRD